MRISAYQEIPARAEAARDLLGPCRLCPRDCRVDRRAGQKGFCGLDAEVRWFREMLHDREETALNPSHQVYFAGCNLRCEYCSVLEWVTGPEHSLLMDLDHMAHVVHQRKGQGARTLNLLGGEPAVSVHGALDLLARVPVDTCVVWNSNMYYHACVTELIAGLADVVLADLKCGCVGCAASLLGVTDYVDVVRARITEAAGVADVVVRCPVLPGHMDCCLRPSLTWIAEHAPTVRVSLKTDYVPPAVVHAAPQRYVTRQEADQARALAGHMGLCVVT